jgi:hypothetical protein
MSWNMLLDEYIDIRNQMLLDYDIGPLANFIADPIYLNTQKIKLYRLYQLQQQRNLKIFKHNTEYNVVWCEEKENEASAWIEIYLTNHYQIGSAAHIEEKIECEQISMRCYDGQWYIKRIYPMQRVRPYLAIEPDYSRNPVIYDRNQVQTYAHTWWNSFNPDYLFFENDDCTNFVSQCLFAGNAPMNYTGKRELGWWYQGKKGSQELWSFSWAVADSLCRFLAGDSKEWHAERVDMPQKLVIGDVISYDWDGNGHYQHSTIVTKIDANGMPLVSAHTTNSKNRFWDYRDSYAWSSKTQYRFSHMPDQF